MGSVPNKFPLWAHMLVPMVLAAIVNGILYVLQKHRGKGIYHENRLVKEETLLVNQKQISVTLKCPADRMLPPGYVIGIVWIVLFGFLGLAHGLLTHRNQSLQSWAMALLIFVCLLYPFYTLNFEARYVTYANLGTFVFASLVSLAVAYGHNMVALLSTVPLLLWLAYVKLIDTVRAAECKTPIIPL